MSTGAWWKARNWNKYFVKSKENLLKKEKIMKSQPSKRNEREKEKEKKEKKEEKKWEKEKERKKKRETSKIAISGYWIRKWNVSFQSAINPFF